MLKDQNIICFAKDWSEDPTSNNHVMRELARHNKVLWLNSIAMRTPSLTSKRDLQKIVRKLKSFAGGPVEVAPNLWVYTPIVLPLPHSPFANRINREILRTTLGVLRRRLGMPEFQLWTFLPNAVRHVGHLGESLVVYYCTDEHAKFSYVDGAAIAAAERELCSRADVVFTTARSLLESKQPYNVNTHLALHGVDQPHFARALDDATALAPELAEAVATGRKVMGFFGLIEDWIDQDILAHIAERRPDWLLVVIGKAKVDTSRLERHGNVRLLGRRPYEALPSYCKGFSVGLMPFVINELTRNVNPIKLREYLSAGLPVVSTDLPEVRGFAEHCRIAHGPEAFLAACDAALAEDSPEKRRARSQAMLGETWQARVAQLGDIVAAAQAQRAAGARAA